MRTLMLTCAHMEKGRAKAVATAGEKIITKCQMAKEPSKPKGPGKGKPRQEQVPACTGVLERPGKLRHLGLPGFSEKDEFLKEVSLGALLKPSS